MQASRPLWELPGAKIAAAPRRHQTVCRAPLLSTTPFSLARNRHVRSQVQTADHYCVKCHLPPALIPFSSPTPGWTIPPSILHFSATTTYSTRPHTCATHSQELHLYSTSALQSLLLFTRHLTVTGRWCAHYLATSHSLERVFDIRYTPPVYSALRSLASKLY